MDLNRAIEGRAIEGKPLALLPLVWVMSSTVRVHKTLQVVARSEAVMLVTMLTSYTPMAPPPPLSLVTRLSWQAEVWTSVSQGPNEII